MYRYILILSMLHEALATETTTEDTEVQYLNELPLDKLLALKNSLAELAAPGEPDAAAAEPPWLQAFGAQAMAIRAPPTKRTDYEPSPHEKGPGKIGNIFTMSVTTLAFLAFGGYLLCLIVQAVKAKQAAAGATPQQTFFVNAGIKRPQFASYGRRRREAGGLDEADLSPDRLFAALLHFCEGYAKWSGRWEEPRV